MDLKRRERRIFLLLGILSVGLLLLSACWGRYPRPGLSNPFSGDESARVLFLHVRLPRVVFSFIVGAVLAVSGLVLQTVLNNPMVDSGFLGVSQGAAFGAALAILALPESVVAVRLSATMFAFVAFGVTMALARRIPNVHWLVRLVLAGMASSALFSSLLGLMKYWADRDDRLQSLNFWLMGGLKGIQWADFLPLLPVLAMVLALLMAMRWRLNLLSLDDDSALSLSVNLQPMRIFVVALTVVATSLCVSLVGNIGWIGLVTPHFARRIFGANASLTVPASMLIGSCLMTGCDLMVRVLFAVEVPPSIFTALIGALLFVAFLRDGRVGK